MKPTWKPLFVILAAVTLPACPVESTAPIGNPTEGSIDNNLIGRWENVDTKKKESLELIVLPFNDSEYYVESHIPGKEIGRFRVFPTKVGGDIFLNVKSLSIDKRPDWWVFARYSVSSQQELTLRFVGDSIVPKAVIEAQDQLAAFISKHVADPKLDDEDGPHVFRRMTSTTRSSTVPKNLGVTVAANDHYDIDQTGFQVEFTNSGWWMIWPFGDSRVTFLVDGTRRQPKQWAFDEMNDHILPGPNGGVRLYMWLTAQEIKDWLGTGRHEIAVQFLGLTSPILVITVPDVGRATYDREFELADRVRVR